MNLRLFVLSILILSTLSNYKSIPSSSYTTISLSKLVKSSHLSIVKGTNINLYLVDQENQNFKKVKPFKEKLISGHENHFNYLSKDLKLVVENQGDDEAEIMFLHDNLGIQQTSSDQIISVVVGIALFLFFICVPLCIFICAIIITIMALVYCWRKRKNAEQNIIVVNQQPGTLVQQPGMVIQQQPYIVQQQPYFVQQQPQVPVQDLISVPPPIPNQNPELFNQKDPVLVSQLQDVVIPTNNLQIYQHNETVINQDLNQQTSQPYVFN